MCDVDVASPDVFAAVFAGAAAVPVSLSAITGVVSSAVFTEGVMTDAIPLVDVQMVTDRVIVLPDAGSALPTVFAEVGAVCVASSAEAEKITFGLADMDSGESVSRADLAGEFSDVGDEQSAVGRSMWTAVPVNMVTIQIDNVGDDRFSPGVGCCADMAHREHSELIGSDSDSSEDCGCRPPSYVDFDDLREYEAECDWYFTEGDEGVWRADGWQEDRNLVYLEDAYSTKIYPVALSSEEGMTRGCILPRGFRMAMGRSSWHPGCAGVFGTTVRTTGGVDREMLVLAPGSYDLIYEMVPQMELLTLEGPRGYTRITWLFGWTRLLRFGITMHETSGQASPFIAVVQTDGFARTYDCGSDSPDFLDTGDPTPSQPVPKLRRCLRVLDFASDIDPGRISRGERLFRPQMSDRVLSRCLASCCLRRLVTLTSSPGKCPQPLTFRDFMQKTVHASPTSTVRESSGYISPSAGSVGPLRSWRSHLFGLPNSNRLVVRESPGLPVREECGYILVCAEVWDVRLFCSDLATESHLFRLPVVDL